ncbi:hypothetical protein Q7P37_002161 [Cladosporium fusiforme]
MAEVFGIATGVLQVAGFGAALGGTLLKCAREIRNANKELKAIAVQVEATSRSLDAVGALLRDPETKDFHTPKLYDDTNAVSQGCHEVFCELNKAVNSFEAKSGKSRYQISLVARMQWPLSSARLLDLQKVLKNYSGVLHLMLAVLQIVEGRRAATKEELRGLEVQLRSLVVSNNKLSESNKSLSDTIAAITQRPPGFEHAPSVNLMSLGPALTTAQIQNNQGINLMATSPFQATSPTAIPVSTSQDQVGDQLQRCMEAVQELANSISSAMGAWQGQVKPGSSDIHGSFAKVMTHLNQLPQRLQCSSCLRCVTWSELNSIGSVTDPAKTCTCFTKDSSNWRAVGTQDINEDVNALKDEDNDQKAHDVVTGRLVYGYIKDDDTGSSSSSLVIEESDDDETHRRLERQLRRDEDRERVRRERDDLKATPSTTPASTGRPSLRTSRTTPVRIFRNLDSRRQHFQETSPPRPQQYDSAGSHKNASPPLAPEASIGFNDDPGVYTRSNLSSPGCSSPQGTSYSQPHQQPQNVAQRQNYSLPPPPQHQHEDQLRYQRSVTSATYIPSADSYGPGVGIPVLDDIYDGRLSSGPSSWARQSASPKKRRDSDPVRMPEVPRTNINSTDGRPKVFNCIEIHRSSNRPKPAIGTDTSEDADAPFAIHTLLARWVGKDAGDLVMSADE